MSTTHRAGERRLGAPAPPRRASNFSRVGPRHCRAPSRISPVIRALHQQTTYARRQAQHERQFNMGFVCLRPTALESGALARRHHRGAESFFELFAYSSAPLPRAVAPSSSYTGATPTNPICSTSSSTRTTILTWGSCVYDPARRRAAPWRAGTTAARKASNFSRVCPSLCRAPPRPALVIRALRQQTPYARSQAQHKQQC